MTTEAFRRYRDQGIAAFPVRYRAKEPLIEGWQNRGLPTDAELALWEGATTNVGVLCGPASNNLVIFDFDTKEAARFCLGAFGIETPLVETARGVHVWTKIQDVRKQNLRKNGGPPVDIIGAGGYALAPPSIHPTGAEYRFLNDSRVPADGRDLLEEVKRAAGLWKFAQPLIEAWREGQRHNLALGLAGFCRKNLGWPEPQTKDLITRICAAVKDPEADSRLRGVEDTYAKAENAVAVDALLGALVAELKMLSPRKKQKAKVDSATLLEPPEPVEGDVDGAEVLSEITESLRRYVSLSQEDADAVALWILFAHSHDAAEVSPLLAITSAEKRSGKTTLRRVVGALVPKPLPTINISAAALYRLTDKLQPTLLGDEADTWLVPKRGESEENAAMRGIFNAGHVPNDNAVRCEGENHEPRFFKVWCPKSVALIGQLPDTMADRSIEVRLLRRRRGDVIKRLRVAHLANGMEDVRRKAWTWGQSNLAALREADPYVPEELDDRAADNWRPLYAIADLVGGGWPKRARGASMRLSLGRSEDETPGVLFLGDVRGVFDALKAEKISTADLVTTLHDIQERPWATWGRDRKGLNPHRVATLLKAYGIRSRSDGVSRGYFRDDFSDVWERFLPPRARSATDSDSDGPGAQARKRNVGPSVPQSGGLTNLSFFEQTNNQTVRPTDSDTDGPTDFLTLGEGGAKRRGEFFTIPLPTFVGFDGVNYGPYLQGHPVPPSLPEANLAALRERGALTPHPPPPEAAHCPRCGGTWHYGGVRGWVWTCCGGPAK